MKKKAIQVTAILIIILLNGNLVNAADKLKYIQRHICEIDNSKNILLANKGQANIDIIVPENACPTIKFAGKELKKFLDQSTTANFTIKESPTADRPAIILGKNEWTPKLDVNIKNLPRDAFIIKTIGNKIIIAGKDDPTVNPKRNLRRGAWKNLYERATLYGVYFFLEKFVGVRFYFPGKIGTIVPKHTTLSVPSIDIYEAPDFTQRRVSLYNSGKLFKPTSKKEKLIFNNREALYLRSETEIIPNCHSLARSDLVRRFSKSHPEYFALLKTGKRDCNLSLSGHRGHLCFSNKNLENEIYKDAEAFLSGKPASTRKINYRNYGAVWSPSAFQPGYFNIMPQDGHGPSNYCQCPSCQVYYSNGKANELIWEFITNIATRLKKNKIPGYVTAMAYGNSRKIPKVTIPDNVLVMLAVQGPWSNRSPEQLAKDDKLIKDWNQKIAPKKVWLWNYASKVNKLDIKGVPHITPRAIGQYYQQHASDITGAYLESASDVFLYSYLNYYVFFKTTWDTSTDTTKLLNEHHHLMFGAGAKAMGTFFTKLEDIWLEQCLGKVVDTELGPVSNPPSEYVIWEKIFSDAVIAELTELLDSATKQTKDSPEHSKRVQFFREHLLGNILKSKKKYLSNKQEIEDLCLEIIPAKEELEIDGTIGDEWHTATQVSMVSLNKAKTLVSTTVSGLWDNKFLYLAIDCKEPLAKDLSFTKRKEDDNMIWQDSSVEIFLNPSGDLKNYYQIIVNPAGSYSDQQISTNKEGQKTMNWDWDCQGDIKTVISPTGWSAELKIPFASLGITKASDKQKIVANFCRSRNINGISKKENQFYSWSPYLVKGFHDLHFFGSIKLTSKKTADKSIIKNGDFKEFNSSRVKDWAPSVKKGNYVQIDKSTYCSNGQSLKLTSPTSGSVFVAQPLPDLKANKKYLLSFFIKTEKITPLSPKGGGACISIYADSNKFYPLNKYQGSMPWTKQGFIINTINKKLSKIKYIRLRILNASGSAWFDDVKLKELPLDTEN